jgi:hypothetical protein
LNEKAGLKPASTLLAPDVRPRRHPQGFLLDKSPSVGYLKIGRKNFYSSEKKIREPVDLADL